MNLRLDPPTTAATVHVVRLLAALVAATMRLALDQSETIFERAQANDKGIKVVPRT